MNAYLQRLYDTGAATAAVDARPAQRSSSPLLAVDQRLATPSYAATFLLGLPGETDPETGPGPEPDLVTLPEQGRRDAVLAPDEGPVRVPASRPTPAAAPLSDLAEPVVPRPPRDDAAPTPRTAPPVAEPSTVVLDPAPVVRAQPPDTGTNRAPGHWTAEPVVERVLRRDQPEAAPTTIPPGLRVAETSRRPQADPVRTDPEKAPPPTTVSPRPDPVTAPTLVHPTAAHVPEPLPPVPAPRTAEPADLAEQVHRLVREAMSSEPTRPRARDQEAGPAGETTPSASRPRTAEAMSVIGPLDRPARATTLYGLRLR